MGEVLPDEGTSSAPGDRATRLRVLVIDDEPLIGMTLRILLEDHDVTVETSGRAARDRLSEEESFDVILCDLMLDDVSGMQLAAWVQEHRPSLETRLVFMTGGAFTDDARAFMRDVPRERQLEKPFSADEIEELLARF
ncbi:MAG: response regulator [Sandaracinaceae bacterium]